MSYSASLRDEADRTRLKHQRAERRKVWQAAHATAFIAPEQIASIPPERIAELQALEDASRIKTNVKAASAKAVERVPPTAVTSIRRGRAQGSLDPPLSILAVITLDVSAPQPSCIFALRSSDRKMGMKHQI